MGVNKYSFKYCKKKWFYICFYCNNKKNTHIVKVGKKARV